MSRVNEQVATRASRYIAPPVLIRIEDAILCPAYSTAILAVVTLMGAWVRLHRLGVRSLWIDEAASVYFADMHWRPFLRLLWDYQGNMTLYYFALRAWIHLGSSEIAVRGLSALFGILTIVLVYALGKRLFDRPTGLIAAALLSVHSFHVAFSQEARGYSLLTFLLVAATYALAAAIESKNRSLPWITFAVTAALCVYAHIFAVLALAAHALAIIFPRPFRVRMNTAAMTAFVFGVLITPMAGFVLLRHSDQISWIHPPTMADAARFLQLLTSQGGILLAVLYLGLCGLAFWSLDGTTVPANEEWALRLLGFWLVLPPALTLAASVIKPLFFSRYMVMCVPALVMLAARGIIQLSRLRPVKNWVGAAAFALVVVLSASGTRQYFVDYPRETSDWRAAVSYILEHQKPGDGVVFYIPNYYAYDYYTRLAQSQHAATEAPEVLYPPERWRPVTKAELERDTAGRRRVWFVLHIESLEPEQKAIIQSTLEERLHLEDQKAFPGEDLITVELYSAEATADERPKDDSMNIDTRLRSPESDGPRAYLLQRTIQ